MSGGVDSSVVAAMLKKDGYDVAGMTLRLWTDDELGADHGRVPGFVEEARNMAELLKIPFYVRDFREPFKKAVVDYFFDAYCRGITPNPCPLCNKRIKFGLMLQEARKLGADYLATGHYARIQKANGQYRLLKGVDSGKDQSYVLYRLDQETLSQTMFPLGEYCKSRTRELAGEFGLPVENKQESQDICFITDNDYRRFLSRYSTASFEAGPIVDVSGRRLGRHKGLPFYTVGQRRGLGVSAGEPLYVVELDTKNNALIVGKKVQRERFEFVAGDTAYIDGIVPPHAFRVSVKIRYTAKEVPALATPMAEGRVHLKCERPVSDVSPGQSAVFYLGERVVGGGIIEKQAKEKIS
ncbi:MAG: tRNA 2-thiouridine(34) synthase MnmA [Proteobacteria bacterium]|nr:tRNA 2-thiouridine(34) synthase MnmA [Pseudomonadota bacterium]